MEYEHEHVQALEGLVVDPHRGPSGVDRRRDYREFGLRRLRIAAGTKRAVVSVLRVLGLPVDLHSVRGAPMVPLAPVGLWVGLRSWLRMGREPAHDRPRAVRARGGHEGPARPDDAGRRPAT